MRAGNITLSLRKSFFFNFVMQIELSLKHALAKSTKGRKHAVRKNTREKKHARRKHAVQLENHERS